MLYYMKICVHEVVNLVSLCFYNKIIIECTVTIFAFYHVLFAMWGLTVSLAKIYNGDDSNWQIAIA